jgi:hypothetical protein
MRLVTACAALVMAGLLTSCGSGHSPSSTRSTLATTTATTPAATATAGASLSAAGGNAPRALQGVWAVPGTSPRQLFEIDPSTYAAYIDPSDEAIGNVSVNGNHITFSNSNTCDGAGTYRWRLDSRGRLDLALIGEDPCPRSGFLQHADLVRVTRTP